MKEKDQTRFPLAARTTYTTAFLITFSTIWLSGEQKEPDQSSEAQNHRNISAHDKYSGKTVSTLEMANQMINHRILNAPKVGETAPDFVLKTADGDREVSLKELHKTKPVVLILSSWGCDTFRDSLAGLQNLYTQYSKEASFVMVYIREVHPLDGWGSVVGRAHDAKTSSKRMATAKRCQQQLRLPFLMLVDSIEDPVATRWAGWPTRVFVIDTDGNVKYAGGQGPWGYKPYQGFVHGTGAQKDSDLQYSSETLEEYLESRFPNRDRGSR